jgi:hypothetical protein
MPARSPVTHCELLLRAADRAAAHFPEPDISQEIVRDHGGYRDAAITQIAIGLGVSRDELYPCFTY